jgi:hypothetical protein
MGARVSICKCPFDVTITMARHRYSLYCVLFGGGGGRGHGGGGHCDNTDDSY